MDEDERKLDRFASDTLERMGEAWPDLEWDRDGPTNQVAWIERWDKITTQIDSYMNAIPT